jgi:hypothetical protein
MVTHAYVDSKVARDIAGPSGSAVDCGGTQEQIKYFHLTLQRNQIVCSNQHFIADILHKFYCLMVSSKLQN